MARKQWKIPEEPGPDVLRVESIDNPDVWYQRHAPSGRWYYLAEDMDEWFAGFEWHDLFMEDPGGFQEREKEPHEKALDHFHTNGILSGRPTKVMIDHANAIIKKALADDTRP